MNAGGGGGGTAELMSTILLKVVGSGGDGGNIDPDNVTQSQDSRSESRDRKETNKKTTGALDDINKKTSGYVRNTLGINLGIASILKQSQIFTGILGTIFQILGALVDVILAPFLPIIVPALKVMAENIPQIRDKAEQIVGTVVKVVSAIASGIAWVMNLLPGKIGSVIKDIVQYWILGLFLARLFGFHKQFIAVTKTIGAGIIFLLKKIFGATVMRGGGGGGPMDEFWNMQTGPVSRGGGGRLAAMRAMRPGMGAMGLGAMAVGGGIALGASQAGGTGAAYSIGGAVIGGGLGLIAGPMGAMIGASIGSIAGGALAAVIHGASDEEKAIRNNPDLYNQRGVAYAYQGPEFHESRRTMGSG